MEVMVLDPNYEIEAKKYQNPIASRALILDVITKSKKVITFVELAEVLNIIDEERLVGLKRRLRAMERDGEIIFDNQKRGYYLPKENELILGKVIAHKDGFGFLNVEGEQQDFVIPYKYMRDLLHGDEVLARKNKMNSKGRLEVAVIRITKPTDNLIVARLSKEAGFFIAEPDDRRILTEILIDNADNQELYVGQMVAVKITNRSSKRDLPAGKVVMILGDIADNDIELKKAVISHNIPYKFSDEALGIAQKVGNKVKLSEKKSRTDLTALPFITIDGEDARDFDDALFCRPYKNDGSLELFVAIADVSHYVRAENQLDLEARERGNSVYFPNKVIPMLPENLSNGICSLNPDEERLSFVARIILDPHGEMVEYEFIEAVICSKARLTYNKVDKILVGDKELNRRYQANLDNIYLLKNMLDSRLKLRQKRGALDFDTHEVKFIFNAMGKIDSIEPTERLISHRLVEEAMILANIAAASYILTASYAEKAAIKGEKIEGIFRSHLAPNEQKLENLRSFLKPLGLTLGGGLKAKPSDFLKLTDKVKLRADRETIETMILRSQMQAHYSIENQGHFGLALSKYSHFTSPIRRYSDLVLHRMIKHILRSRNIISEKSQKSVAVIRAVKVNSAKLTQTGGFLHSHATMQKIVSNCSHSERRADEATRDVNDYLKCDFMHNKLGQVFAGTISAVTRFGFFVKIDEFQIDGLVHISNLGSDYYVFDEALARIIGEQSREIFRVGDKLNILVAAVSVEDKTIDFELIRSKKTVNLTRKVAIAKKITKKITKKNKIEDTKKAVKKKADKKTTSKKKAVKKQSKK